MFFDKEVFFFQLEVDSQDELFEIMAAKLMEQKLVKNTFLAGVKEREQVFPTGLPTQPFGVAIPHTDGELVEQQQIAFASLKKPISFRVMGSETDKVDVKVIFMLALKKSEDQLEILQKLIELLQEEESVKRLAHCQNNSELNQIIQEIELK